MQRIKILNRDVIKYIAMVTMLLNHIGNVFMTEGTWNHIILTSIGYFTAPTMIYFLIEGYHYTKSKQKYLRRLFLFALISQIPYSMAFSDRGGIQIDGLNMMFTLCICFLVIWNFDITSDRRKRGAILFVALAASSICDWPVLAPMFTFIFLRFGQNRENLGTAVLLNTVLFGIFEYMGKMEMYPALIVLGYTFLGMMGIALSGLCIMYLYNGKQMLRGRNLSKWFFYGFYPAHLFVLSIIKIKSGI